MDLFIIIGNWFQEDCGLVEILYLSRNTIEYILKID